MDRCRAGTAGGAAYLQYLGPPVAASSPRPAAPEAATLAAPVLPAAQVIQGRPGDILDDSSIAAPGLGSSPDLPRGAPIPGPMPALLAASAIDPTWLVPRIGPDGLTPMQAYAASRLPPAAAALLPPGVPRVAVLVAGLGEHPALDTMAAALPPEISLAFSPYGGQVAAAAVEARKAGHESVLELPMPGLLAGYPQLQNQSTLDWSMAQFQGFAGVTDAFGPAMGGGFLLNVAAKTWLMNQIARRGLFYIEGDTDALSIATTPGRIADDVIDGAGGPDGEAVALAGLITDAQSHGAALAVMLDPTPDALRVLGDWASRLVEDDVLLVPVSALVQPPDIPLPIDASLKQ